MSRKQLYRRVLCMVLLVTIIYTGYYAYNYVEEIIPNKIHVIENEVGRFDFELPIAAEITSMDEAVVLAGSSEVWSDTLSLERRDAFSVISMAVISAAFLSLRVFAANNAYSLLFIAILLFQLESP